MTSKVLVCGSAGQLGIELTSELTARGYEVTSWDRPELDITDRARVEQAVGDLDPAIIINAAAYNQVDLAESEPETVLQVNSLAVRNLALAARQLDAFFVHYSTDYVFDGTAGRCYTEEDRPHPLGAYAVSKYAGELYAQAYLESPLIIRTSGVFGPAGLGTPRGNFVELMKRLAESGNPIRVVEDHVASPTYAPALASRTVDLVERKLTGVFHIGGGTPIAWFDWARTIFRVLGVSPELKPTNEREYRTAARRPKFSALCNVKMEKAGLKPMPSLEDALKDYFIRRAKLAGAS